MRAPTTYAMRRRPSRFLRGRTVSTALAFSAAHVVADPFAATEPSVGPAIDWTGTLAFRRHLLDLGLGIAEAMDTAQRGGGLDWSGARELIGKSLAGGLARGARADFSGVGTDQLGPGRGGIRSMMSCAPMPSRSKPCRRSAGG